VLRPAEHQRKSRPVRGKNTEGKHRPDGVIQP
jgi:hypothetical protein